MNKELRDKIAADIEKSGFGSEMKTLRITQDAGWDATSSVHFTDLDSDISRESDIAAHKVFAEASDDERVISLPVIYRTFDRGQEVGTALDRLQGEGIRRVGRF